ncbi:MAG: hypothetical protein J0M16_08070 [Gammaproteobacteria bacterium]|nr:hypothetical protein [Gammaproteobacteria bacterium]
MQRCRHAVVRVISVVLLFAACSATAEEATGTGEAPAGSGSKVGSFFKKFADDVKAGVKAGMQGTQPQGTPAPGAAPPPAKVELPRLDDKTAFGKTAVAGLRIGMSQAEAVRVIRQNSPALAMHTYLLSTSALSEQRLRGAIGLPKPAKPDPAWQAAEPHLKVGVEFTSGTNFGGDCIQGLRPGMPGAPGAQTCERIWLQTTPEATDDAKVVAISRTLLFGGDQQPAIESLIKDIKAKYGEPSAVAGTIDTSRGKLPVLMVWAFDAAGNLEPASQAAPLSDRIAGWSEPPRPFSGGWEGRVNVIGGDEGPEFTRLIHVSNSPRQLTVAINQSVTGPLLAGRLHVTLMDPGGVLKNHDLRIAAANKLIDEHNARIDKAQQDVADKAAKNKPAL